MSRNEGVRIIPRLQFLSEQRAWYRERLADVSLLDQAVVVDLDDTGECDLAVPVGSTRRFGSVSVFGRRSGRRVIEQLSRYPDLFPRLRYVPGGRRYSGNVCWGEDEPRSMTHREHGMLCGYSEASISQFEASA